MLEIFNLGVIWQGRRGGIGADGLRGVSRPRAIDKGPPIGLAEFNTRES